MSQSAARSLVRLKVLPSQRPEPSQDSVPAWVRALAVPAWVTAPDGTVAFLNEQAEALLGVARGAGLGVACHRLVGSRDGQGRPYCRPGCRTAARAARGEALPPVDLRVGPAGAERWARWLVIPITAPDGSGPWLVHCVHDVDRERRATTYVERLARRSDALREAEGPTDVPLSPREREILELLEEDEDLGRIAARLSISHATVRNHVQRLTAKLGAHSVQEAVALHVLG